MEQVSKLSLSVGIPAYNEAQNIGVLLGFLLQQNDSKFSLEEIFVVCDGCTDSTLEIVSSFEDKRIKIIEYHNRRGQQAAQNDIVNLFQGEVLILLEADTLPVEEDSLEKLIEPFIGEKVNKKTGLVLGTASRRLAPVNFLEKVLNFGSLLKEGVFLEWRSGDNVYACHGHAGRALARHFAKELVWPNVPEDAYMYFRLKQLDLEMVHSEAIFQARNVTNFRDRKIQTKKFLAGKKVLEKYFDKNFILKEYSVPKSIVAKHIGRAFIKNPVLTVAYVLEVVVNRLYNKDTSSFDHLYTPYHSSKKLVNN